MKKKIADISVLFLALAALACVLAYAGLEPPVKILISLNGVTVKLLFLLPLLLLLVTAQREHARALMVRLSAVLGGGAFLFMFIKRVIMPDKPVGADLQSLMMYVFSPFVVLPALAVFAMLVIMSADKELGRDYLSMVPMVLLILAVLFVAVPYLLMSTASAENYKQRQELYMLVGAKTGETLRYILLIVPSALLGILAALKKSARPAILFNLTAVICLALVCLIGWLSATLGQGNYNDLMIMTVLKPFLLGAASLWIGVAILHLRMKLQKK